MTVIAGNVTSRHQRSPPKHAHKPRREAHAPAEQDPCDGRRVTCAHVDGDADQPLQQQTHDERADAAPGGGRLGRDERADGEAVGGRERQADGRALPLRRRHERLGAHGVHEGEGRGVAHDAAGEEHAGRGAVAAKVAQRRIQHL